MNKLMFKDIISGFSVITIIECAVLFIDLVTLCCNKLKEKQESPNSLLTRKNGFKESEEQHDEAVGGGEEVREGNKQNEQFTENSTGKAVHIG